jgi:type I restriction enzyme S subunit
LYFIFQAAAATGVFAGTGGKSTIAHLPAEALRRYRFAFPPLSEQLEIASFLDRESVRFDTLTAEAQRAIDLLQERRTAVISAAVTGQIDVRQFSKKEAS